MTEKNTSEDQIDYYHYLEQKKADNDVPPSLSALILLLPYIIRMIDTGSWSGQDTLLPGCLSG